MSGFPRTATRDVPGMISLRICRCLPLNSERSRNSPVMLPPGRAMLATSPASTGSISRSIPTIGIVRVAFLAAAKAQVPRAKITSTLRSASSMRAWGKVRAGRARIGARMRCSVPRCIRPRVALARMRPSWLAVAEGYRSEPRWRGDRSGSVAAARAQRAATRPRRREA